MLLTVVIFFSGILNTEKIVVCKLALHHSEYDDTKLKKKVYFALTKHEAIKIISDVNEYIFVIYFLNVDVFLLQFNDQHKWNELSFILLLVMSTNFAMQILQ